MLIKENSASDWSHKRSRNVMRYVQTVLAEDPTLSLQHLLDNTAQHILSSAAQWNFQDIDTSDANMARVLNAVRAEMPSIEQCILSSIEKKYH